MVYAYLDSSIWITWVEGAPGYRTFMDSRLEAFALQGEKFVYSEAVSLEVLRKPMISGQNDKLAIYHEMFRDSICLPIYDRLLQDALLIAVQERIKAMDALHVAYAVHYHCKRIVTADRGMKRIKILSVDLIDLSAVPGS